ncbi:MAG: dihydroneopterin aldolase [Actinomycetota bacterium]|nr:dihydroneopterin aldolase [Actinomycetota bacterium]
MSDQPDRRQPDRHDRIQLRGLRAVGVHGFLPHERERAQPFEVDLDVAADLRTPGESDDLEDTLDYGALAAAAQGVVTGEHCHLLERLAERIAEEVLSDDRVSSVTVTVKKLRPPVPIDLVSAGVSITRP